MARTAEWHVQRTIQELVAMGVQITYANIDYHLETHHGICYGVEFVKRALEQECEKNAPREKVQS